MSDFWTVHTATAAFTYGLGIGFLLLYLVVLAKLWKDDTVLQTIIAEKDSSGKGSIGRFQLLVFTLTIAGLYVILSIEAGALIDVPNGTLALLGISGGSFLMSKGIGTPKQRVEEKKAEADKELAKAAAEQAKSLAGGGGNAPGI